jgi:curved DNA-binding protein CbpA
MFTQALLMTYYEELGVRPEATEQEIRKAHRRLVKQTHPDFQADEALKSIAEKEMGRLNSIVTTLLNPEKRRAYDKQLREVQAGNAPHVKSGGVAWKGVPWWFVSALGAIALSLGSIWLWADHTERTQAHRSHPFSIPPAIKSLDEASSRDQPPNAAAVHTMDPHPDVTTVIVPPPDKMKSSGKGRKSSGSSSERAHRLSASEKRRDQTDSAYSRRQ